MSLKKILSCIVRADLDYNLIEDGDQIAVGVSGGKDSMLLLKALKQYQKYPFKHFTFIAVFLDLGFKNVEIDTLKQYCSEQDINLHIENSQEVFRILSQHKNSEGNLPCSICSRMKKAAINNVAHRLNCNKVAFAHHLDDALETLLMNEIYGGRIATFSPKMFLSNSKIVFIRPFILVREKDIIAACKSENIPIIKSSCPNDHVTMREEAKQMLNHIYKSYPSAFNNFRTMLTDYEHFDLWFDKRDFPLGNGFTIRECQTKKDIADAFYIRQKVFVEEFNIPMNLEFDGEDREDNIHIYLLRHKDHGIGTLSYQTENENVFRLRRFALLKEYRSQHLGSELFKYVECEIASKYNPCMIYFNAMECLQDYYQKLGYVAVSEPFIEEGTNISHIRMEKRITKGLKYKLK